MLVAALFVSVHVDTLCFSLRWIWIFFFFYHAHADHFEKSLFWFYSWLLHSVCNSDPLFSPFVFLILEVNCENFRFLFIRSIIAIGLCRVWETVELFKIGYWLLCHSSVPRALHACVSMDSCPSFWPRWSCTHLAINRSVPGFPKTFAIAQLCSAVLTVPHSDLILSVSCANLFIVVCLHLLYEWYTNFNKNRKCW
jgi:hypothetical protein